ncbi:hypothetical protein L3X38_007936 [Prunus dulcis]|uniref:Uncharacterized protein n=1 Tax=Prunus dulcis TaxID=3755 RepID=A0AAD4ZVX5_PRUDU|nr:hypothetical protein L3X38_007936 [Prunus dulcis]
MGVPIGSSHLHNHVLLVWSELGGRIDHDRVIAKFLNPSPRVYDFGLGQLERFKIHTWLDGNGGRRREIDGCEDWTTPAASSPFFGEITAAGGGSWLGLEEDDAPVISVLAPSTVVAGGRSFEEGK